MQRDDVVRNISHRRGNRNRLLVAFMSDPGDDKTLLRDERLLFDFDDASWGDGGGALALVSPQAAGLASHASSVP